jgi:hypothetical protein
VDTGGSLATIDLANPTLGTVVTGINNQGFVVGYYNTLTEGNPAQVLVGPVDHLQWAGTEFEFH